MDVARKALILGRLLGFPGELEDIEVESLVPEEARGLPLEEFLRRLDEWDEPWRRRTEEARSRRRVLRYRCIMTPRRIRVGLAAVDASNPLAALNGTGNQFRFTTPLYPANPHAITGPVTV